MSLHYGYNALHIKKNTFIRPEDHCSVSSIFKNELFSNNHRLIDLIWDKVL